MDKKPFQNLLVVALAIMLVLFGIAPIIAVFRLGTHLAGYGVILTFQIIIAALGVVTSVYLTSVIVTASVKKITDQIESLQKQHAELLEQMKKRTPAFTATFALVTEAVKIIGDKSFEADAIHATTISLLLIILFWVANQLAIDKERWKRVCGIAIWFATIAFVPFALILHHHGNIHELLEAIAHHLDFGTQLTFVVLFLVLIILPLFFGGDE